MHAQFPMTRQLNAVTRLPDRKALIFALKVPLVMSHIFLTWKLEPLTVMKLWSSSIRRMA
jgi:hypothetical protein